MRKATSLRRGFVALAALAAVALAAPAASLANPNYVALGDSYTSGPGILPYAETAPAECGQSSVNYPHLTAAALHLSLTDVSCGGAKTENFNVAQGPHQGPQFNALSAGTEVVSVGMGGNDNNLFGTLVTDCTEADIGKPNEGAPCREYLKSFIAESLEKDGPEWAKGLAELREHAPNAKVFYVGYPEIAPENGYCPEALPWTTGDLNWSRTVEKKLNALMRKTATEGGATFVNTFKSSEGHNACEAVGTRWIEPLFGSLTGVPVHPNELGEQNDSYRLIQAMLRAHVR
jgi:hypothetical protein